MLKNSLAAAVIAIGLLAAPAQARTPAPAATQTQAPPVPLMWKACDADNCVYLLGSFHVLKESDYPLSKDVDDALKRAALLMFEITPEEMASPQLAQAMMAAAVLRDGRTLNDALGPALAARLDAWAKTNQAALSRQGIATSMLQMFKPWFASILVTMTEMQAMGMKSEFGLDNQLAAQAKAAGKPVAGLETGASQIAVLDGMSAEEQQQMVAESLDAAEQGSAEIAKLHDAWRRGDADALLAETVERIKADYPRLYRSINVDRNTAWMPKLQARLDAPGIGDTLVVVGAMHLLGGDGVVEQLRAKGYRVERVCSACAKK